jgi:BON domain
MTILAACLALTTACSRQPDDVQIVKSVQTQIQQDRAVTGNVKVESAGGFVTLSGSLPSEVERSHAAEDASGITSVRGVFNHLTVDEPTPASARRDRPARRQSPPENQVPAPPDTPVSVAAAIPPQPADLPPSAPVPPDAPVFAPPPVHKPVPAPPAPPPAAVPASASVKRVVPSGTALSVRLVDALDSSKNNAGDIFHATLNAPLTLDGDTLIRAGAEVQGRVVDTSNAGRPDLILELLKLTSDGTVYPLETQSYDKSGGKNPAQTAGTSGVLGTIIGAISGGRGGGNRAGQGGKRITFPSDAVLTFKLQEPLTVVTAGASGRDAPVLVRKQ